MDEPIILVLEDEGLILASIEDALVAGGFSVITCSRGKDAMRHLHDGDNPIAGLITDIRLAGEELTGWDVATAAREISPSTAIVYMSGDSGNEWRSQGVPDSTFLQKPFASAQVLMAISTALNAGTNFSSP